MGSTASADGGKYYSCPRCARTYASAYPEVFRKSAGARPAARAPSTAADQRFVEVKARLEAWLRRLDEQDPWFVLGVAPGTELEKVRARFRELALVHHPDRGGDAAQMRRITRAYDACRVQISTGRIATGAERRRIAAPALLDVDEEA